MGHLCVGVPVCEQQRCCTNDLGLISTNQQRSACLLCFGAFRRVPHQQYRLAEARRLLLNAAGVSKDKCRTLHHGYERQVWQWLQKVYVLQAIGVVLSALEQSHDRFTHVWIQVDRVHEVRVYELSRQFAPYIGVNWTDRFGKTADFVRAGGGEPQSTQAVIGLRAWF